MREVLHTLLRLAFFFWQTYSLYTTKTAPVIIDSMPARLILLFDKVKDRIFLPGNRLVVAGDFLPAM
jgi:hypothetical protein